MKKIQGFRKRMLISTVFFIFIITILCLGAVYYWSFFHFKYLFEDRVIDQYTFQKNQDMGVKNEWILGVTTDSIDVVEGIHGPKVAQHLQNRAQKQQENTELYRETIDGKHLLYTIELNTQNGEMLYKYSIIKDIYAETFPQIAVSLFILAVIIIGISSLYSNILSHDFYNGVHRLRGYSKKIAQGKHIEPIDIKTCDQEFQALAKDLEIMRCTLEKNDENRQQVLQYISHELKTPLMIIEGYASSALDGYYPKGTLEDSLNTILTQSDRIKNRVQDLLTIVHLTSLDTSEDLEEIAILPCIQETVTLLGKDSHIQNWHINVKNDLFVYGSHEHIMILLENLISNQIKYGNSVSIISQSESKTHHIIKFYNDGPKIPKEIQPELFKPFVKGSSQGSGLGLPICQRIMNQLNGNIRLDNSSDGTVFILEFPKTKPQLSNIT